MIIEVSVTKDDYLTFCKFTIARVTSFQGAKKSDKAKSFIVNLVVWAVIAFTSFSIFQSKEISFAKFHWPSALAASAPLLLFIAAILAYLSKAKSNSLPKENGPTLGKRVIEINDRGIRDTNSFGTCLYKWTSLDEVVLHEGNVYLFLDTMLAQIIPSSTFSSKFKAEEFKRRVETMHNNALQPFTKAPTEKSR